jgi:hypothetical protein
MIIVREVVDVGLAGAVLVLAACSSGARVGTVASSSTATSRAVTTSTSTSTPTSARVVGSTTTATLPSTVATAALPQGGEAVALDPANLVTTIDNPDWPMKPGTKWVYRETDADGARRDVEVTVTDETKTILGVQAVVVHDVVRSGGRLVEDTFDWYAQDKAGNVWYLGEDTTAFEKGTTSREGSWEVGVDGAQAGVIVAANPQPGMVFRQEYHQGHAEDRVEILSLDEHTEVPFGSFDQAMKTQDTTPLEPDLVEQKYYARDVGPVEVVTVSGGSDHEVLVDFVKP